jgi:hypothetical protein
MLLAVVPEPHLADVAPPVQDLGRPREGWLVGGGRQHALLEQQCIPDRARPGQRAGQPARRRVGTCRPGLLADEQVDRARHAGVLDLDGLRHGGQYDHWAGLAHAGQMPLQGVDGPFQ